MLELRNEDRLPDAPEVSVFCTTYNQVDYISQCLDGFLSQETDFPFEVLIADDASADGTADVVRSYVERRPDVLTAILQDVNQFSQGIGNISTFLWPRARGRYVAFCEGDDWWTDPHKLQRQHDAMEAHPEAAWCVHASENVSADTGETIFVSRPYDHDCTLEFVETGEHVQLAATASFFVRRDVYESYINSTLRQVACHGDFKMSRFFPLMGSTLYLEKPMSAYRVLARNSINTGIYRSTDWRNIVKRNTTSRVEYLNALKDWADSSFAVDIGNQIERMEYLGALDLKDYRALHQRWPNEYASEPFSTKLKVELFGHSPRLHDFVRKIKLKHCPYLGLGN